MFGALGSFLSSLAAPAAAAVKVYSDYKNYQQSKVQSKALRTQNARNAQLQEDAFRRGRARNLASLSGSGLAVSGTPQIILQDNQRMADEDAAYQGLQDASNEKLARYNTQGAAFGAITSGAHAYGKAFD